VQVRLPDGSERTLAFADVREATLVVEWKDPHDKPGARRP
jgi:hypothetical protein